MGTVEPFARIVLRNEQRALSSYFHGYDEVVLVGGSLERQMKLNVTAMGNGITRVSLSGRLDVQSAIEIDDEFTKIAKESKNLVVDLSDVTFIASLGIRTMVVGAKATANNGGKMVLLNPQPNVEQVLRTSHIDTVMPISHDAASVDQTFGS